MYIHSVLPPTQQQSIVGVLLRAIYIYPYELLSKLLVSPLIAPIVVPYIIPHRTPFKEFRL